MSILLRFHPVHTDLRLDSRMVPDFKVPHAFAHIGRHSTIDALTIITLVHYISAVRIHHQSSAALDKCLIAVHSDQIVQQFLQ